MTARPKRRRPMSTFIVTLLFIALLLLFVVVSLDRM